ncbi:MAG: hypothetical protein V1728_03820 [Candidatus Micrarchaeota archaeon]
MGDEYEKKLAITRLMATPPDVRLMIGGSSFTTQQLIREIESGSRIGKMAVTIQLNSIRNSATITKWLEDD